MSATVASYRRPWHVFGRTVVLGVMAAAAGVACSPASDTTGGAGSGGSGTGSGGQGTAGRTGNSGTGGMVAGIGGVPAVGSSGGSGVVATGGAAAPGTGGTPAASGGAPATGGGGQPPGTGGSDAGAAGGNGGGGRGGSDSGTGGQPPAGSGGRGGTAGPGTGGVGAGGGAGSGVVLPPGCNLPGTVGFQADVQPFLIRSCGGGSGCHLLSTQVINNNFNRAYDWITDVSHCPNEAKRFAVSMDLVNQARPASCSNSRIMPPQDATGANRRPPLTPCEKAALESWLNQPLVTQPHNRNGMTYPMPRFN